MLYSISLFCFDPQSETCNQKDTSSKGFSVRRLLHGQYHTTTDEIFRLLTEKREIVAKNFLIEVNSHSIDDLTAYQRKVLVSRREQAEKDIFSRFLGKTVLAQGRIDYVSRSGSITLEKKIYRRKRDKRIESLSTYIYFLNENDPLHLKEGQEISVIGIVKEITSLPYGFTISLGEAYQVGKSIL